jgi:hypothetical protein
MYSSTTKQMEQNHYCRQKEEKYEAPEMWLGYT